MTPTERLSERAESYGKDAARLRAVTTYVGCFTGEEWALIYNTIRDELRKVAEEFGDGDPRTAWDEGYAAAGLAKIATHARPRNPYAE